MSVVFQPKQIQHVVFEAEQNAKISNDLSNLQRMSYSKSKQKKMWVFCGDDSNWLLACAVGSRRSVCLLISFCTVCPQTE